MKGRETHIQLKCADILKTVLCAHMEIIVIKLITEWNNCTGVTIIKQSFVPITQTTFHNVIMGNFAHLHILNVIFQ